MKEEHLEIEEQQSRSLKDLLVQNLDYIVAGLAALALLLHFAGYVLPVSPDARRHTEELKSLSGSIVASMERHSPDVAESRLRFEGRAAAVRSQWEPGSRPELPPSSGLIQSASITASLRKGEDNVVRFRAPKDLIASAERGSINLTWLIHEDNNVRVVGFVVYREGGGSPMTEVARTERESTSYADTSVRAGVSYTFRVRAVSDDPHLAREGGLSEPSLPVTQVAVDDHRLTLIDSDDSTETAVFKIEKWHEGGWFDRTVRVRKGEGLGSLDAGIGVDFTTGRRVASLKSEPISETGTRPEVVFGPDGRVSLEGGAPVTEAVTSTVTFQVITVVLHGEGLAPQEFRLEKR